MIWNFLDEVELLEKNCMESSIYYARKIFRKTNISRPLIRTRMCVYQVMRNVSFSGNLNTF